MHINLLFSKKKKKIQTTPATLAKQPGLISFFKSSFTAPATAESLSGAHEALHFWSAQSFLECQGHPWKSYPNTPPLWRCDRGTAQRIPSLGAEGSASAGATLEFDVPGAAASEPSQVSA